MLGIIFGSRHPGVSSLHFRVVACHLLALCLLCFDPVIPSLPEAWQVAHAVGDRWFDLLVAQLPAFWRIFGVRISKRRGYFIGLALIDLLPSQRENGRLRLQRVVRAYLRALLSMSLHMPVLHVLAALAHNIRSGQDLLDTLGRLPEVAEVPVAVLALVLWLLVGACLAV